MKICLGLIFILYDVCVVPGHFLFFVIPMVVWLFVWKAALGAPEDGIWQLNFLQGCIWR